ncbi:MAG: hypothetical protein JSW28_07650 [Thermoplasmata archaeon]|nr:MAG: hypothetical protein JSW28_07650 [Thermoplasmata archaeon]
MPRANFEIVIFNEQIGEKEGVLDALWYEFVGSQTSIKHFQVPGVPTGLAYIMIQVFDVQNKGHRIIINGEDLPGEDIIRTKANRWQDVTDIIPAGVLQQGDNTIRIKASSGDNILIGAAMIHWKEV